MLNNIIQKFNKSDSEPKNELNNNNNNEDDALYGMPPEEESRPYPRPVQIVSNAVYYVWSNILIRPFATVWNFLAARTNLTFWILVGMVVGILIGRFAPAAGVQLKPLGDAFIRMITIIETPLIFSTLVVGIAGHGDDVGKVGRLAIKTIIVSVAFSISMSLLQYELIYISLVLRSDYNFCFSCWFDHG